MRRILIPVLLLLVSPAIFLFSQRYAEGPFQLRDSYGIFGSFDFNQHNGKFTGLPGIPSCCPRYETGSGVGYMFGAMVDLPMGDKWELEIRAAYTGLNGLLSRLEPEYVYDPTTDNGTRGAFRHSIDSKISSAALLPMLSYRMSDKVALSAGIRAGYLITKTFSQKEEISDPSFGTFQGTDSRVRNQYSGDIPDAGLDLALAGGISYYMPLNSSYTMFLVPEAMITYGVMPVSSGLNWHVFTFNAGLSLKYAPREIIPEIPAPAPPMPPLPAPPDVPALAANITAVAVDENGAESSVSTIKVEEMLSTQTHPLLNYIFFDENSSVLPSRYVKFNPSDIKEFNDKHFSAHSTLDVYYDVLNIIAKRMLDNPKATISINGYNCGEGAEKNNLQLSKERAESVRDYLVNVWNLPASRIKVSAANLPPLPSSGTEPAGVEENRRVEIISGFSGLLDPVVVSDTVRKLDPPKLVLKPQVNSGIGIDKWEVSCYQADMLVKKFSGSGELPARIDWDLSSDVENKLDYTLPLDYKMVVNDNNNNQWASPVGRLPIVEKTYEYEEHKIVADKEIDQFTLTLFGFDKADIDGRNARAIESAKKRIKGNSIVSVKGYTDQIGEEQHNLQLSQRRASAAAKALGVNQGLAEGLGESVRLYDNNLPEQRIYSRSVIISIETPVK